MVEKDFAGLDELEKGERKRRSSVKREGREGARL